MTFIEAIISGAVQGATEFLPVSSSGHLVLVHSFFGASQSSNLIFDVLLHIATLFAVLIYFRGAIAEILLKRKIKEIFLLAAATVPAVVAALLFKGRIEVFFASPRTVVGMLLVTGAVLLSTKAAGRIKRPVLESPGIFSSLFVGLAQAFALVPGISRSGMTISAGLFSGMDGKTAFRFSFLLSIPAILGAGLLELFTLEKETLMAVRWGYCGAGMAVAFLFGLASLSVLGRVINYKKLYIFGWYCIMVGLLGIFYINV